MLTDDQTRDTLRLLGSPLRLFDIPLCTPSRSAHSLKTCSGLIESQAVCGVADYGEENVLCEWKESDDN